MSKDKKKQLSDTEKSHTRQDPPPTFFEWGVRLISLLVILSFLGYFTWSALEPDKKPLITFKIQQDQIEQRGNGWVVPVKITNEGDMSVHTLTIRAVLQGTEEEEMVEVALLGSNEAVTTEIWFNQMPSQQNLQLDVASYVLP